MTVDASHEDGLLVTRKWLLRHLRFRNGFNFLTFLDFSISRFSFHFRVSSLIDSNWNFRPQSNEYAGAFAWPVSGIVRMSVPVHVSSSVPVHVSSSVPAHVSFSVPVHVRVSVPVHVNVSVQLRVKERAQ